MLYDTHLHLIYPDKLRYPWLESFEVLNKPSIFDSYLTRARRVGITACLHMEVDVAENQIKEETALVADLMARPQSPMRGAISACRPEDPNFPEFLDWARTVPTIKGFRRVLHVMPDELSQTDTFRNNISRLTGTGLTFDLCVLPHQLVWAGQLIDHCPDVTFILNHCGVPDVKGGEIEPWGGRLSELAKRPNVLAKISGLIAYGDPDSWSLDDLRPFFEHTVSAFSHNRLVWGSDSPVCNLGGGLETWVGATHALTDTWQAADKAAFLHDNAAELWG